MKLLVIFCSGSRIDEVRRLVEAHGAHGFTEIPEALGAGATGRHMGTRAYPGTSTTILTAVEAGKADELVEALREWSKSCTADEGIRVLVLPVERMI